MTRKLSLEERITLFNLTKHPVFSGSRDTPVIRTVADYDSMLVVSSDRTIDALMNKLDREGIPDTTNSPYSLYFIGEWVATGKPRLDLMRLTHDRKMRFTSNEMRERVLNMALDGALKRDHIAMVSDGKELIHTFSDDKVERELKDGDMLFVQSDVYKVYAAWVSNDTRSKICKVL